MQSIQFTHPMRRFRQALSETECVSLLKTATSGVLALCGAEGQPYAVPLSYVYRDGTLLFHCAAEGRKLELLEQNCRASFCVIAKDQIVPEEYTTYFQSVIVFGPIHPLESPDAKRAALSALGRKYAPEEPEERLRREIERAVSRACVLELSIEQMTGKEAIELARRR